QINRGFVMETYPPLRVGVKPNSVHSPTDMSRELSTVTTAASARPHFDFTMSIFPEKQNGKISPTPFLLEQEGTAVLWTGVSLIRSQGKGTAPLTPYIYSAGRCTGDLLACSPLKALHPTNLRVEK
uniref:Uncharacterized protein n=1 Tax=Falco tinnunculus TaxID=100819 RepID=A0A8C4UTB6_FALTI